MNKTIKVLAYSLIVLTVIFIPLLFVLKFDNYQPCTTVKNKDDQYIILTKDVYSKLNNYKQIKLLHNKKTFNARVEDNWSQEQGMYYAKVTSSYIFDNDDLKIFVNYTNLFNV